MTFLSRDSHVGVPKSRQRGLLQLWSPITLRADLGSKCSLKKSFSSHRELSNGMWHVIFSQVNRVDSRLFLVRSQIGNLTSGPSFGHNLCFRSSNEQFEPILNIYVSKAFQWYKERHKPLRFDPSNCSLKFWESTRTPSPKVRVALGVWGFTPSHFLTLPGVCDVTPGLPLGPHPCNPFALVASPKLRLWHFQLHYAIMFNSFNEQIPYTFFLLPLFNPFSFNQFFLLEHLLFWLLTVGGNSSYYINWHVVSFKWFRCCNIITNKFSFEHVLYFTFSGASFS